MRCPAVETLSVVANQYRPLTLEDSCRRYLKAFPTDYRLRVGDELLASLLAAHAGRQRLPMREAIAMIAAGAQMRVAGSHLARAASLRWSGKIAVAALAYMSALALSLHLPGQWAEPVPHEFVPAA